MSKSVIQVPVVEIREVAEGIFRLTISAPEWSRTARAGQFVNIQIPQRNDLLWRRPFSVHSVDPVRGTLDILFAVAGRGSAALSEHKAGDSLNVLGLLGNCFTWTADLQEIIIAAGGLGIAPFILLLQQLENWPGKKTLFLGFRSSRQACCMQQLGALGAEMVLTTEDGSLGHRGLITTPLDDYLASLDKNGKRMLFLCGPTPMMRAVRELTQKYDIPAQVTVENRMACGFGACVGCPVELAQPREDGQTYMLACKDGPVFPLQEIVFND